MPLVITHIERQPRRKRLLVHLSDGQALSLTADVAGRLRLAAGRPISDGQLEAIRDVQAREDALAAALRLVAFRPRSEREMLQALGRQAVPPAVREETIARLRELGLLDDAAFAASYVKSRDRTSPRSRRLLSQELRQKGLAREIAGEAAATVDDADAAYRAAVRRARSLSALPFPEFQRRLGQFLLRRGFSLETAREAVVRAWEEMGRERPRGEV